MKLNDQNKVKNYWRRMMDSLRRKMSQGAEQIARIIPYAHKDNWRRNDKVQRGHDQHTKHHHHDRK